MRTLTIAALILLATGCDATQPATPATPPAASTPAATATYDGNTLAACREANAIQGDIPADQATQHARQARGEAELSDMPALREIARKYAADDDTTAMTAAATIADWCLNHHVP